MKRISKTSRRLPIDVASTTRREGDETAELLNDIVAPSDKVSLRTDGDDARVPSFAISRAGTDIGVRFAGLPMGHEFTSLVLALLQVGGHPPRVEADVIEQVKALIDGDLHFETYFSLTCQNCPDVVQALNLMSVLNPKHQARRHRWRPVPGRSRGAPGHGRADRFCNGEPFGQGRMGLEQILAKIDTGARQREAAARSTPRTPFDVLVIGGGPAGAAAAIYAARKGIRTGVVAERFGGQVLDTMAIENFISVSHTEGPKLATALEQHVKDYEVDIMNLQQATALIPAAEPGGLADVRLESGAALRSPHRGHLHRRPLAPDGRARRRPSTATRAWPIARTVTARCSRASASAVIGGGNSGVEAAIDLAGIVAHVTLLEFDAGTARRRRAAAQALQPAQRRRSSPAPRPPKCTATARRCTA